MERKIKKGWTERKELPRENENMRKKERKMERKIKEGRTERRKE